MVVGSNQIRSYSPYSLRIGGAVHMHDLGADELTIKAMGRWDSSTYQLYIRTAHIRSIEWSRKMATQPASTKGPRRSGPGGISNGAE